MTKKTIALVLALLLFTATIPMTSANAQSSQPEIAPLNLLSVNANLSKSGSELLMYVRFLFISPEATYFNVALQQLNDGIWTSWSSYSDVRHEQAFFFEKNIAPPKGYTYRLKVTGSSPSFPGFEFYSNEIYY